MPRPRLLICGFGPFPGAPRNPAAAAIETLAREGWTPAGVEACFLTLPVAWRGSVEAVEARLAGEPSEAVLLVGVAQDAQVFRVECCGQNRAASARPDARGELWAAGHILAAAPPKLAVTAPHQAMAHAIAAAGLPVALSTDAGDYLCNFTLYRLLHLTAGPRVGFLHTPQAREYAEDAAFALADVEAAVRAAAGALAQAISGGARATEERPPGPTPP